MIKSSSHVLVSKIFSSKVVIILSRQPVGLVKLLLLATFELTISLNLFSHYEIYSPIRTVFRNHQQLQFFAFISPRMSNMKTL